MKQWLKLALTTLAISALGVMGVVTLPSAPASANEDATVDNPAPAISHAARNSTIWVGADADGALYWSEDEGTTWNSGDFGLTKSGVSSVIWTGDQFLATSYFEAARSSDGKTWTRFMLPLGSAFDPGNLISDAEFFRSASMSVDAIQAFLEQRNPDCREGFVCMKDYTETTFSRDQTVLCNAYEGAENETAAQILHKVSAACGVSVEALLVLIQKEQSLVTLSAPSEIRFERATGYACPDTAPCDSQYFGFYNQVYNAAKQFKRYSNPPGTSRFFTWFPVGQTVQVRLHPNAACGTRPVAIKNQATAGLYYYTPYTPNDIALVNLASVGDSCSAYGNRNFWRVYNYWFNPTKDFPTMATTRNGLTMVVDRDGTIATSTNLTSWQRIGVAPGSSASNSVSEFGQTSTGNYAVLMADGSAYESSDGVAWNSLSVQVTEVNQDIVTRHTVKSGDTVWAISRANGVSVSAVVTENALPRGGSLIRVGQVLTITKKGVLRSVDSPVILDPSIVIASGSTRDPESEAAPEEQSEASTESGSSENETTDQTQDASESSSESTNDSSDAPLPALEPVVTQTETNDVFYTVVRGDTLIRIAFRNGTTVSTLVSDNAISNRDRIFIGQRLKVGVSETTATFHRGQEGDTLTRIAERRSVSLDSLLALNPGRTATGTVEVGDLVRLS